jgi:hypothetical protein
MEIPTPAPRRKIWNRFFRRSEIDCRRERPRHTCPLRKMKHDAERRRPPSGRGVILIRFSSRSPRSPALRHIARPGPRAMLREEKSKEHGICSGVNISKRNPEKRKRLFPLSRHSQGRNLDRHPTRLLFTSPLSSHAARGELHISRKIRMALITGKLLPQNAQRA